MDISVNWLRSLAPDMEGTPEELAARLSLQAVAVDAVEHLGGELADVVVGRVLSAEKHPDADRLTLCRVEAGGEPLDVVCGAPNVEAGASYPFVPPGGTLPGDFKIERRKIRGIVSNGMLCSEQELGLGRDSDGILRLADGYEPGTPVGDALGLPDARLVLDLTPNRVDLACHVGVARELAPGGVSGVEPPSFGVEWVPEWATGEDSAEAGDVKVTIEAPDRCPRYLAAVVRGVQVGPSPDWLRARLRAAGSRPINNVVDATNYVLLEQGQPLHAFDLGRLDGPEIRVRAAAPGETLTTLDGRAHELDGSLTVIADAMRPVAFAGVMGGADSEVTGATTDLLLECALFDAAATRETAARAGLSTDASYHFERGIDEHAMESALRRCVELVVAVAGGMPFEIAIRVGRNPLPRPVVGLRPARVRKLLGLELSVAGVEELLRPLGFEMESGTADRDDDAIAVTIPGWRGDVTREVDLIEEIARRHGYDNFPTEPRPIRPSSVPSDETWARRDAVRDLLEARGLLEARSLPMVPARRAGGSPVELLLPLSATESVLRTDLVPPLLDRVQHNWAHGQRSVRLYEIGSVFASAAAGEGPPGREGFLEDVRVAVVLAGSRSPEHWSNGPTEVDAWDLRGLLEEVADRLTGATLEVGRPPADHHAPGTPSFGVERWLGGDAFAMFEEGVLVGVGGSVREDALDAPPWAGDVFAAEFRLAVVRTRRSQQYVALPAFPAVGRDLALLVPDGLAASEVETGIRKIAPRELAEVRPFDVYEGQDLGEGRRSVAWRLVFRAEDRTLTDGEVEKHVAKIVSYLREELDVRVRES